MCLLLNTGTFNLSLCFILRDLAIYYSADEVI